MTNWKKHTNRRKIRAFALIFLPTIFFVACEKKTEPPARTVASVDDVRLTESRLNELMKIHDVPYKNRKEAVNNWIEEQIYWKEAEARGLLASEKYKIVLDENKRQIAKALLIDDFLNSRKIGVTDAEISSYYEKHKGEFILREKAYLLDRAFFDDLQNALEFRKKAISKGWNFAEKVAALHVEKNRFTLQREIYPQEAIRAVEFLNINEVSPALKNYNGKYIVFKISKKFEPNDYYPFPVVREKAKARVALEKRVELFAKYKNEIFSKHKIEIYGDLNE